MKHLKRIFVSLLLIFSAASTGAVAQGPGHGPQDGPNGVIVTRHFSGLWELPEHQSQGFTLHVVHQYSGERVAVAFWFTFGEDRESAWLMGQGPVIDNRMSVYKRRETIVNYAKKEADPEQTEIDIEEYSNIGLSRSFAAQAIVLPTSSEEEITAVLREIGKEDPRLQTDCGACGYGSCRELAVAVSEFEEPAERFVPGFEPEELYDSESEAWSTAAS